MDQDTVLRLLVLIRHAKAVGTSPTGDIGRSLSEKGRRSAERVGGWLLDQGVRPDVVILSPSARTLQTWDGIRAAGLSGGRVVTDDSVYEADPEDLLATIREVSDEVGVLVVLGHAPGIPDLAARLQDHTSLDDAQQVLLGRWPPAAVGVVSHRGSWAQFPLPDTSLALFHAP
ncbi:MAG TPA: histidine phosphatase family protein [Dermatophilaceae bacterium]|nr:histidine phosphatase family protein [Dermatophilaceae bacterium]